MVVPINSWVREHLGLKTTVLRCLRLDYDSALRRDARIYELECHTPDPAPPANTLWAGLDDLMEVARGIPGVCEALKACRSDRSCPDIGRRQWAVPGWWSQATSWVRRTLSGLGLPCPDEITQMRTWERSCIARTGDGQFYFKAVPPMFAHEPRLTRELARWYPRVSPEVVALDEERGWMLLRSAGQRVLEDASDVSLWEETIRTLAQLQIDLSRRVDRLLALGCPDRRLNRLEEHLQALLADDSILRCGSRPLTEDEIRRLRGLGPVLKATCRQLAACSIPPSLEHGDFWAGQVVIPEEGFAFIDWSDSSVSCPFFSMATFLAVQEAYLPGSDLDAPDRLRAAYLREWTAFAPLERLREAFRWAEWLAPIHNAVTYHRFVLPFMETRWEMENMVGFYLRALLKVTSESGLSSDH